MQGHLVRMRIRFQLRRLKQELIVEFRLPAIKRRATLSLETSLTEQLKGTGLTPKHLPLWS